MLLLASGVASAQTVGTCDWQDPEATVDLDGNNVRARLYNTGGLFWKGSGSLYLVPKEGEANSIFASGIWIGGLDEDGVLRFAGTAYGPFEYFPGPLDAAGNPPPDCSAYDRIYKVTRRELELYDLNGTSTPDMRDWPWQLGAPVDDGDGNPDNYSLAAGDRPGLIGEQTAWWVMNDVGGPKEWSGTRPIGLEVQVTAFALTGTEALENTTYYRYRFLHKGSQILSRTWLGIWVDPDLGNAGDDYVGSDTTLGIGFVYNGTNVDYGADGYGERPPALGYDFLQGPLVPDPEGGTWVDPDGTRHPGMTRRRMTNFVYYTGDATFTGNPNGHTIQPYWYMQSIWRDGTPMTVGGNGYGGTVPTTFMFPGDPAMREYWSEENTDGKGSRNTPADRRFLMSTGPFDLEPGDEQEIVFAIVWSQSTDRLASVTKLKLDDIQVQAAYDNGFHTASPPDAPILTWDATDRAVDLSWSNPPGSNNFLNAYEEPALLREPQPADGNTTYSFEGYQVLRFAGPTDRDGQVVATYDVRNGVDRIVDLVQDPVTGLIGPVVSAEGTDSGVKTYFRFDGLVNFRDYELGVRAYAYNPNAQPRAIFSPVSRVTVRPAPVANREGGMQIVAAGETVIPSVRTAGIGTEGGVFARVVSPGLLTGELYELKILDVDGISTYDLRNATSGITLIDGREYVEVTGSHTPFGNEVFTTDGLSFSVNTEPESIKAFIVTANAGGVLDPPEMAAFGFNSTGFPFYDGHDRPSARQQVGPGLWGIHTGEGNGATYADFVRRSIRNGWGQIVPWDWEIRFTERCRAAWEADQANPYGTFPDDACYAYDGFGYGIDGDYEPYVVPFEIWNIGAGTPDDPSDDFRLIPAGIDWDGDGWNLQCWDHEVSGGANDPVTDWIYTYLPDGNDTSPGEAGYDTWRDGLLADHVANATNHGNEVMARLVLVNRNGGSTETCDPRPTFTSEMPEVGTVFRMTTSKPLTAGDVFEIDTAPYAPIRGLFETADDSTRQAHLDLIGVVPNPYKGASAYERDPVNSEVRFVNLPDEVTIRIFTLSGTLVKTLRKNGPSPVLRWDLRNENWMRIASGMYLVHVDAPGLGEKVIKLGVVRGRLRPGGF